MNGVIVSSPNIEGNIQQIGDCIKAYSPFGKTVFVNICNGQQTTIPWGIDGYIFLGFVIIFLTSLVVIFCIGLYYNVVK